MKIRRRKALTAIEMIFCVAIIVAVAAMILPKVDGVIESAKKSGDMAQISAIANAISQYKYEVGNYPSNLGALLVKNGVYGPWMPKLPSADAWSTTNTGINGTGGASAYCYAYTSSGFAVWALGKNKANNSGGGGTTLPTAFSGDDYGVLGK